MRTTDRTRPAPPFDPGDEASSGSDEAGPRYAVGSPTGSDLGVASRRSLEHACEDADEAGPRVDALRREIDRFARE